MGQLEFKQLGMQTTRCNISSETLHACPTTATHLTLAPMAAQPSQLPLDKFLSCSPAMSPVVCPHKGGAQRIESTKAVEQPLVKRQLHDNQRVEAARQALSQYVNNKDVKTFLATIVAFAASEAGGRHHVKRQTHPRSTATCIRMVCPGCDTFKVNVRRGKKSGQQWYVDFSTSSFEHRMHPHCTSKPCLSGDSWRQPRLCTQIRELGPTALHVRSEQFETVLRNNGIHVPTTRDNAFRQMKKRLKATAFGTGAKGLQLHLTQLQSWVDTFNFREGERNGLATIHTMEEEGSKVPVFRALTVVFDVSVRLFLHCSFRVLSLDGAFQYVGRDDQNYVLLEGITATKTIYPLAVGICFGESKETYDQFLQDVFSYSDALKKAIDSPDTRINADRHPGLRLSVEEQLTHGRETLHNDSVHLKRNVRTALQKLGRPFSSANEGHQADRLLDELMQCNNHAELPDLWESIRSFNASMHNYLQECEPTRWIEAFFRTTMDGFMTTSNSAEQENARFKRRCLRHMQPLDFLDGACAIVTQVGQEYLREAQSRLTQGHALTSFAQTHMDGARDATVGLYVSQGLLVDNMGCFVVKHTSHSTEHGCVDIVVRITEGIYSCNDRQQFAARMGLPCENLIVVHQHMEATRGDTSVPALPIHQIHHNETTLRCLKENNIVVIPCRGTLQAAPLRFPPLAGKVRRPRSTTGLRFRSRMQQPTASSVVPPPTIAQHASTTVAQERLRRMRNNGPALLLVLHKQRLASKSVFRTQCTSLAHDIPARDMWRPYRYMPAANGKRARTNHGEEMVLLNSLLHPCGPRRIGVRDVLDVVVVNQGTIENVQRGRTWNHPVYGQQPPLRQLLEWNITAVEYVRRLREGAATPQGSAGPERQGSDGTDGVYEVERVLDHRPCETTGRIEYKVRWHGYAQDHDTWEPLDNLGDAQELVDEYTEDAATMWQGQVEPLLWSSMEFGTRLQVLTSGEWRPAVVTGLHADTRTVSVCTSAITPSGHQATKSRQLKINKKTWLRKPT